MRWGAALVLPACAGAAQGARTVEVYVAPVSKSASLQESATAPGAAGAPGAAPPRGDVAIAGAIARVGNVGNLHRVVAAMRPAFRACYAAALARSPTAEGSFTLVIEVGEDGEVAAVSAREVAGRGLDDALVRCMKERVEASQFDPPDGDGQAVIEAPIQLLRH